MGIIWDRPMRQLVTLLLAEGTDDMKAWDADERDRYERLRLAGYVTRAGELDTSLYRQALVLGVLAVQATFKLDSGQAVFAVYAAQALGGGALTQPISVSAQVREAVALGLATGRLILRHAQSGDYEVVAR